ncbi:uncharacterized protein LAESUDRAFT_756860 [Laetiporus sulphureus 93-53]|uniref:DUF5745 domain-containing protein n=1 Tax=Laetiporus sulphureus 93-53 TaxID=1314785 RepID=A0A165FN40_9APHY|nr:uncharacterized protein LAESUDRAFT_756860 [Laetiporus sulphureus 93-53]KZT09217.1 hypothetical protein LAESUDRAFT_756860 [Laetiporus sulphureus 93-53]
MVGFLSSPHDASELVASLNTLLHALDVSHTLTSPQELTPSLLLTILEALLPAPLDIPLSLRHAHDTPSKMQAVKVFLGVLGGDVIQRDVGLSKVDPRRLARGAWEEVVFVGELLCWLARLKGIIPADTSADLAVEDLPAPLRRRAGESHGLMRAHTRSGSLSTRSTMTSVNDSHPSSSRTGLIDSDTTDTSLGSEPLLQPPQPRAHELVTPSPPPSSYRPSRPRCIHEVNSSSRTAPSQASQSTDSRSSRSRLATHPFDDSYSCSCSTSFSRFSPQTPASNEHDLLDFTPPSSSTPHVRYSGLIHRIDDQSELHSFEASEQGKPHSSGTPQRFMPVTKHNSPAEYTVALLRERAKLLTELAQLKTSPRNGG